MYHFVTVENLNSMQIHDPKEKGRTRHNHQSYYCEPPYDRQIIEREWKREPKLIFILSFCRAVLYVLSKFILILSSCRAVLYVLSSTLRIKWVAD